MRTPRVILLAMALVVVPASIFGAEPAAGQAAKLAGGHEAHGVPQAADVVGHVLGLPVTNSMVVTWVAALGLIVFAQAATRTMKEVPEGAQNFWEWMVESLHDFLEGIIGHHLVNKTFWFFATLFIFILFTNWVGLIPGFGSIGWGHHTPQGFVLDQPWLRSANADLNMTLAMALTFFACWLIWAVQDSAPSASSVSCSRPKAKLPACSRC